MEDGKESGTDGNGLGEKETRPKQELNPRGGLISMKSCLEVRTFDWIFPVTPPLSSVVRLEEEVFSFTHISLLH